MFDAFLSDLAWMAKYVELFFTHHPERSFEILSGALLVLVWLMRR